MVKGYKQITSVDYTEAFAPVIVGTMIRTMPGISLYHLVQLEDGVLTIAFDGDSIDPLKTTTL